MHNRCQCHAPATWMLRIVPDGTDHSSDMWATCDAHLSESARFLMARNAPALEVGATLQLRAEV